MEPEIATEGMTPVAGETLHQWLENAEGVEGYTITFEIRGRETTATFVKEVVDEIPVFTRRDFGDATQGVMAAIPLLLRYARHDGTRAVAGKSTDVLVIDDAAAITRTFEAVSEGSSHPTWLEIKVGRDDHLIHQVSMVGQTTLGTGEFREVITTLRHDDWRTVDRFIYPFRTTLQTEHLAPAAGFGAADQIGAMEELERSLQQVPESEREGRREALRRQRMRESMRRRIEEAHRSMDAMEPDVVVVVKRLRVRR